MKLLIKFLIAMVLLSACTTTQSKPLVPQVPSDVKACLKNTPNVVWNEKIEYVDGYTSSAVFHFLQSEKKIEISQISIAKSLSPEKEAIAIWKELCGTAYALESFSKGCITNWNPITACMDEASMNGMIDALGLSYLKESEQKQFLPQGQPTLTLETGEVKFTCSVLKTFQSWSKAGAIVQGNWPAILVGAGCQ